MKKYLLLITLAFGLTNAKAQMWGAYTLYSAKGANTATLIDTNGITYKTWTFPLTKKTCFSSYLIPGDTLLRTVTYMNNILAGGPISGETQKVDWAGNIVWDFIYSDSLEVSHHDVCAMPNGNVLIISLDVKSAAQATQAGTSTNASRWSEKIIEVHPTGPTTGTIVWEWHLWDHMCQTFNAAKDNYVTSTLQNPQLINVNYKTNQDFIHMNGIDYNDSLDQITFSSFGYSEIYVIDHSTTTAEAASHTGGNSGHGGDILYRWGNPAAYGAPGAADFNVVHDAHWVPSDNPYFPNYLCGFNNKGGAGTNSAVDIIAPPYNGYNYSITPGTAFGPANYDWRYTGPCQTTNEGGSQQLPNGNTLMTITFCDSVLEVDHNGNRVWSFGTPGRVTMAFRYSECYVRGPVASANASATYISSGTSVTLDAQGVSVTENNPFYTYSWTSEPAGFSSNLANPTLSPTSTSTYIVTITDTALGCSDTASVTVEVGITTVENLSNNENELVYPNPTNGIINIKTSILKNTNYKVSIHDAMGKNIFTGYNPTSIDLSEFGKGIYFLSLHKQNKESFNYKVIY